MKINDWNIFERWSTERLLIWGIIFTLIGSVFAFFLKGRFDGALDLHFVAEIRWFQPFVDNFLAVILLTLGLFITSKFLNSKTRFIDLLNAVLISRIFIYFILLGNINGFISQISEQVLINPENIQIDQNTIILILFGLITIAVLFLFLFFLYLGFRVATNYKKLRGILYFIFTIAITEIISLLLYTYIL